MTRAEPAPAGEVGPGAIDEFLHTPARLGVLSLLAPADWVRFSFLRDTLGTSASALSKQLSALQEAGYVETRRDGGAGRGISVRLTSSGRAAFDRYLRSLELLVARARGSRGETAGAAAAQDGG